MPLLISPDGKTEKQYPADYAQKKIAEGWKLASGQEVGVDTEYGKYYLPAEQAMGQMAAHTPLGGGVEVTAEEAQQDWAQEQRRQEYEGRGLEAALAGAGRGLTFGATDVLLPEFGLVDKDTLQGLQEFEPGLSTAGELGSVLVGGIGALGKGAIAKGLRATPMGAVSAKAAQYGTKGTKQFLGANAAEGALYGMGNQVSQIALSDADLTAETAVSDIFKGGALGGIMGLGAGAAFKGGEKLWKARQAAKAPKAPPHLDIKTPEGAEFLGGTAARLEGTLKHGDDLFKKTDPMATRRMTDDEIYTFGAREKVVRNTIDDSLYRGAARRSEIASQAFEAPVAPKALQELDAAPARDMDALTGRLAELEEELAGAAGRSATEAEEAGFDAMMRRNQEIAEGKSFTAGAKERKGQRIAEFEREVGGKAKGGVDPDRLPERAAGLGKAEQRAISDIEQDIADLQAKIDAPEAGPTKAQQREIASYEKKLEAYESQVAYRDQAVAQVDEALDALKLRKKHFETQGASRGGPYEKYKVTFEGDAVRISDDINAVRRLLGDSAEDLKAFAADSRKHVQMGNEVTDRLRMPVPEGTVEARTAYEAASRELAESMGAPSAQNLHKLMNAEPEEMAKGFAALVKYTDSMEQLAKVSGDKALLKSTNDSLKAISKHVSDSMPPEVLAGAKELDLLHLAEAAGFASLVPDTSNSSVEDLAQTGLIYALLRGRRGLPIAGLTQAAKQGGKASSSFLGRVGASGAAGSARAAIPAPPGILGRGMRGAGGMAAYQAFGGAANRVLGARGLHQLSGRSTSQIVQAIDKLAKKGGRQLMTGKSAAAVLTAAKFLDAADERHEKSEKSLQELFAKRSEQIRRLAHNPQRLAEDLWAATADMRDLHPVFGDRAEVGIGNRINYAMQVMPKDPGGHHVFGGSSWQPDDFQVQEFANVMEVLMDPMSAVQGVVDGSLTPEAAEAFRATAPRTYALVQQEIASRADELAESLDHDEQSRLAILMGVPVSEETTPEYAQFIASTYAKRQAEQAESMGKVDANALTQGVPTQAQQLLNRGTKR